MLEKIKGLFKKNQERLLVDFMAGLLLWLFLWVANLMINDVVDAWTDYWPYIILWLIFFGFVYFNHRGFYKKRDWNIRHALNWWADTTGKHPKDDGLEFFDTLRQLAYGGEIIIWGVSPESRLVESIDPDFWRNNQFDTIGYINAENDEAVNRLTTHPNIGFDAHQIQYSDLRVTSTEVKKKWHAENI